MRGALLGLVLSGIALAEEPKEFTPPDGWKPKKRGQYTVYCRKDFNVKGTRMPAETCYDEEGIRAMLATQQEDRANVDQMRKVYTITTF